MASQSPLGETPTLDYSDSWAAVNRMIREGESWSGRELNCALLNTGDGAFLDASHTMGLAYADDGRNFVSMDWDGDGDLDLWVKNRTAPQVRFLRNDGADGNWLRLQLENSGTNREALGARVEVRTNGKLFVRERRAGTGFLVQESSWLHFGLGAASAIESVVVRWPGGATENFTGARVNGKFVLRRGSGVALGDSSAPRALDLQPSVVVPPRPRGNARIVLSEHLAIPGLELTTFAGETRRFGEGQDGGPLLVSFWASWCSNCLGELREWAAASASLQEAGIDLLALSVDAEEGEAEARALWKKLAIPFDAAMAPHRVLSLFDLLQRVSVDRQRDMVVPTSFLLDAQGRIAVIYRGPLDPATLIADVQALESEATAFAGAPFAGRAFGEASGVRLFQVARRLLDIDDAQDALYYLGQAEANLNDPLVHTKPSDKVSLADALMRTGVAFMEAGELKEAADALSRATLLAGPDDAIIWFAKAKLEAVRGDYPQAVADVQRAVELDPQLAIGWSLMGTLKLTLEDHAGAVASLSEAIRVDPGLADAWSALGVCHLTQGNFQAGHDAFAGLVAADPRSADGWTGMGMCLLQLGQTEAGVEAVQRAVAIDPQHERALEILKALGLR